MDGPIKYEKISPDSSCELALLRYLAVIYFYTHYFPMALFVGYNGGCCVTRGREG